jgi:archaellum component FlaC
MSTDNIVLEHLRSIRGTVERTSDDIQDVKVRLGNLENQYASISNRLDRLDARVLRIEKRLDLVEV